MRNGGRGACHRTGTTRPADPGRLTNGRPRARPDGSRQFRAAGKRVGVYKPVTSGCDVQGGKLISPDAVIISFIAGVRSTDIAKQLGGRRVARVMPTTAAAICQGTASLYAADPEARAKAIVKATTYYKDPLKLLEASEDLGMAMAGLDISKLPEGELMQTRGW